ncbi:MAG: hypothetical protein QOF78_4045 [Phycisphaerales bacterium]|jgi:hypothetical protein|nr:hypothetical protein [Phycisphaerales bacterium]
MTSISYLALASLMLLCLACAAYAAEAKAPATATEQRLSGPYTHGNLTIFLVHGPNTLKEKYLTLEEAMTAKHVKVHETGDVNELAIENTGAEPVFIQSGDIVKGGKQDRCIGTDFTLAPNSGKVKIAAFCVENGRWQQRGGESTAFFSGSTDTLASKELKLAGNANYSVGGGQQKVWDEVKIAQQNLSKSVSADFSTTASPSSLQLTLENKNVREAVDAYVKALGDSPSGKDDVIGYAAVINGKMNCADVYGSNELFQKIWPRSLKSVATEAAGESNAGAAIAEVPAAAVEATLRKAEDGTKTENEVNGAVNVTTTESKENVMFESRAKGETGYLRRSVLTKE